MDNVKNNAYYLKKMITDIEFVLAHTEGVTEDGLEEDEILLDSVMFRLVQISENSDKLTPAFKTENSSIPWRAIKGMRNRIVHEYGDVEITIVYETVVKDLPVLLAQLKALAE